DYLRHRDELGAIFDGHLGERMPERMRTASNVINTRHSAIFNRSPANAVAVHLLIIMRNKKVINIGLAARFNIIAKHSPSLRLKRYETIIAVFSSYKNLIIGKSNVIHFDIRKLSNSYARL